MIPQVTAAALVSENKSLAFPASVDSIPTSAGQEDHVSMAPIAARKAAQVARNAAGVIAVELMAAAEGIDYHAPLKTSPKLQEVHAAVRALFAAFHRRPLLGRRNGRASGGRAWRRNRRGAAAAALADPVPVRRLADDREHAAANASAGSGRPAGSCRCAFMSRLAT